MAAAPTAGPPYTPAGPLSICTVRMHLFPVRRVRVTNSPLMILLWNIIVTAVFVVLGPSGAWGAGESKTEVRNLPVGRSTFPERTSDRLRRMLAEGLPDIGLPGVVMHVSGPEGFFLGSAGLAEILSQKTLSVAEITPERSVKGLHGRPMTPDCLFHAGSIRKTVTAAIVMRLARDGRLSRRDTAASRLPDIRSLDARITIGQLLHHTSGLPDYTLHRDFYSDLLRRPTRTWTGPELIRYALELAPGRGWCYSNTNYVLLGMIIDGILGENRNRYIRERLFEPLGMKHTYIPESPALPPSAARGYRYDFLEARGRWTDVSEWVDPSFLGPAGALVSNAEDLNKWLDGLLDGRVFGRPEEAGFVETGEPGYRYGPGLKDINGAVGHDGDYVFGYQALTFRDRGYNYVILTNGYPVRPGVTNGPKVLFERARAVLTGGD